MLRGGEQFSMNKNSRNIRSIGEEEEIDVTTYDDLDGTSRPTSRSNFENHQGSALNHTTSNDLAGSLDEPDDMYSNEEALLLLTGLKKAPIDNAKPSRRTKRLESEEDRSEDYEDPTQKKNHKGKNHFDNQRRTLRSASKTQTPYIETQDDKRLTRSTRSNNNNHKREDNTDDTTSRKRLDIKNLLNQEEIDRNQAAKSTENSQKTSGNSAEDSNAPYRCLCGMAFWMSQAKAGHCKKCPVYKEHKQQLIQADSLAKSRREIPEKSKNKFPERSRREFDEKPIVKTEIKQSIEKSNEVKNNGKMKEEEEEMIVDEKSDEEISDSEKEESEDIESEEVESEDEKNKKKRSEKEKTGENSQKIRKRSHRI
eukprot:TRINITY_DN7974_c0_g1_i1.p1 TRINITY_DN7974_c0_g1~~TRINITY_DN7974_c0_g1_i1.p1  ORF type:complete len:368 (-),score=103.49 TRINITY_DN7974_c0_g1_i1:40-1143(-)